MSKYPIMPITSRQYFIDQQILYQVLIKNKVFLPKNDFQSTNKYIYSVCQNINI